MSSVGQGSSSPCERPNGNGSVNISAKIVGAGQNILEVSWTGDRLISRFKVSIDGKVIKDTKYDDAARTGSDRVSTSGISSGSKIVVELVDVYGFKYSHSGGATETTPPETPNLPSITEDNANIAPFINITNPAR